MIKITKITNTNELLKVIETVKSLEQLMQMFIGIIEDNKANNYQVEVCEQIITELNNCNELLENCDPKIMGDAIALTT
jgi:hypothetical protein